MEGLSQKLQSFSLAEPVGILGYGVEGESTYRFLNTRYSGLSIFERNDKVNFPEGAHIHAGANYLEGLDTVKTLFCSPGIRRDHPFLVQFTAGGGRVTSQTELFFALLPPHQIIGVTGTLGKGTCCTLISQLLSAAKIPNLLLGNIGTPFLDGLEGVGSETKVVLELSSFQLGPLRRSPHMAVVLKTTSEHLDWHTSKNEYWDFKANLVRFQEPAGITAYFEDSDGSQWIASQSKGRKLTVGGKGAVRIAKDYLEYKDLKIMLKDTRLTGSFNLENIGAAVAVAVELGVPPEIIREAICSFSGLEHRLEYVGEKNGVIFYNDSYATRPEATVGAVTSFKDRPLALILGGSDKRADFLPLVKTLSELPHLKSLALIGDTRHRLKEALECLDSGVEIFCAETLEEAGSRLLAKLKRGVLLLSPACASFGLFANYQARGRAFKNWFEKINSGTHV